MEHNEEDLPVANEVHEETGSNGGHMVSAEEWAALQERLTKAETQRDEFLRTVADYETSRRRAQRDAEQERKYANEKFARDLLPALDNLDRAISVAKQAGDRSSLAMGVMATHYQIIDILKRYGITMIVSLGEPFDPHLHQAVKSEPTTAQAANTVLEVLQQGFMLHDRVLRPAAVIVASAPTE